MFKYSQCDEYVNRDRPKIEMRNTPKVKMKLKFTKKERVLKSPYYICNKLWDQLDYNVQRLNTFEEFALAVKRLDLAKLKL